MAGRAKERKVRRIIAATIAERFLVVHLPTLALPDSSLFHGANLAAVFATPLRSLDHKLTVAAVA